MLYPKLPWTKLEADSIRFLLCYRRRLKLDSSDSSSAIDELRQLTSSTQSIADYLRNIWLSAFAVMPFAGLNI
ncbi:hypothetical protein TorRG33x02_009420 [Trema orientale]|uniref:Uncharacterized protein n=1 Tax=Trema orientale TaxID=63057 RepID=A0A2P5FYK7_TREOI|nr:hypothetical protein TorRG33x02_009420 [Trema orientale]